MIEETLCPICNGPMVSRKSGATGQRFWGCKQFPKCKGTRNTDGEAPRQWDERMNTLDDGDMPSERQRSNDRRRWL